ncbi:MAG: hypothetical protein NT146_12235 [Mycobacterium sp.]|nr:hypothetical protein [Mycobacterium sp.]
MNSADTNRLNWDERAPAHAASPGYHVDRFVQDPAFLSYVVQFDVPRLGDIAGLRGVHLQCHIGTDTISLARLGARMTGLDFSPAALIEARQAWSTPASVRCAGCRTSAVGRRPCAACCGQAVDCSSGRFVMRRESGT